MMGSADNKPGGLEARAGYQAHIRKKDSHWDNGKERQGRYQEARKGLLVCKKYDPSPNHGNLTSGPSKMG